MKTQLTYLTIIFIILPLFSIAQVKIPVKKKVEKKTEMRTKNKNIEICISLYKLFIFIITPAPSHQIKLRTVTVIVDHYRNGDIIRRGMSDDFSREPLSNQAASRRAGRSIR